MRQFQVVLQPLQFLMGPCLDFDKGVCSGQYRRYCDHPHFNQIMLDLPDLPRVTYTAPYFRQPDLLFRLRGILSKKTENYTNQRAMNSPSVTN